MTFAQIVQAVKDTCTLSSPEATTRIGTTINRHHARVTAQLGMETTRQVTRDSEMTVGVQTVTFANIEKIDRILDVTGGVRLLQEVGFHDIRSVEPGTGQPTRWAVKTSAAGSVTVIFDTLPAAAYALQADGVASMDSLSGNDEPMFGASFHDVLTWAVCAEELLKKDKEKLALIYERKAEKLLSELVFSYADSPTRITRQAQTPVVGGGVGSVGGASLGESLAFIQAGTGAVLRTAQSKMREIVSASDFNAIGDGTTNDYAALTAACAYLTSRGGGGLYAPSPDGYLVNSQFVIPERVRVYGPSMAAAVIKRGAGIASNTATVRAAGAYLGLQNITIDNDNRAGDALYIVNGNYGYFDNLRIINVDGGACVRLSAAGSNKFKSCIFHAHDGQCFVMVNGVAVSTELFFSDVECISDGAGTDPAVVLDGALNFRSFGGAIQCTSSPGLKIQNIGGVNCYALYVETVADGMVPVDVISGGDINFHGGTFNSNQADVPVMAFRAGVSRATVEGNALISREGTGATTPMVLFENPALGNVSFTMRNVTFRSPVNYTAVECDGTQPIMVTLEHLHDRNVGEGTISVKARDGRIAQTLMDIELLAGSLSPVTIEGCRGSLTDPDFAANVLGRDNIGILHGSGSPEGVVAANLGALYINTAGGAGTTFYVKEASAGGATGWDAKV